MSLSSADANRQITIAVAYPPAPLAEAPSAVALEITSLAQVVLNAGCRFRFDNPGLFETRRIAGSAADNLGETAGEVDDGGRFRPRIAGIDDCIHLVVQALLDFPSLGQWFFLVGQEKRAGQQRLPSSARMA